MRAFMCAREPFLFILLLPLPLPLLAVPLFLLIFTHTRIFTFSRTLHLSPSIYLSVPQFRWIDVGASSHYYFYYYCHSINTFQINDQCQWFFVLPFSSLALVRLHAHPLPLLDVDQLFSPKWKCNRRIVALANGRQMSKQADRQAGVCVCVSVCGWNATPQIDISPGCRAGHRIYWAWKSAPHKYSQIQNGTIGRAFVRCMQLRTVWIDRRYFLAHDTVVAAVRVRSPCKCDTFAPAMCTTMV